MAQDLVFLHSVSNPECRALVDKHFEGYSTLQYATAGAIELFYDEERHELRAENGACWFWSGFPGPRVRFHRTRDAAFWNHRYAAFTGTRLKHWKDTGLWLHGPQIAPRGDGHAAAFDELIFQIHRSGEWARRRAVHVLEGILLELAEARASTGTDEAWLQRVRDSLVAAPEFSPNYDALARGLGMGLSTLRRKFKAATGLSLHEACLQLRLESARRLLAETDLPLKTVAARLGYRDLYFFSSQFKQLAGVTPSDYRRSRQG